MSSPPTIRAFVACAVGCVLGCTSISRTKPGAPAPEPPAYRAGAAKVKITPPSFGSMAGWDRSRPAEGVAVDLWARALVLEDTRGGRLVLVSLDVLGLPPALGQALRQELRRAYGLDDGQLMIAASDTHGGPDLPKSVLLTTLRDFEEAQIGAVEAYGAWLKERLVRIVGEAVNGLAPAKLSFGRGRASFGVNRRVRRPDGSFTFGANPDAPADPDVPVLRIDASDGRTRAVVFAYACQATAGNNPELLYQYSSDYPGVAARTIEEALPPGGVALFMAGPGGDVNPYPRGKVAVVEQHGRALAASVLAVVNAPARLRPIAGDLKAAATRIDLPLGPLPPRDVFEKLRDSITPIDRRYARAMLDREGGVLPRVVSVPLQVWALGKEVLLIALGGELCVDYGLRLKREIDPERVWVAGYVNEVPSYVPSERVLAEGGYEAGWDPGTGQQVPSGSMRVYFWPARYAPGIEERVVSAIRALVAELTTPGSPRR